MLQPKQHSNISHPGFSTVIIVRKRLTKAIFSVLFVQTGAQRNTILTFFGGGLTTSPLVSARWDPLHPDRRTVWTVVPPCGLHDCGHRKLAVELRSGPPVSLHSGGSPHLFCQFMKTCAVPLKRAIVYLIRHDKHTMTSADCPLNQTDTSHVFCFSVLRTLKLSAPYRSLPWLPAAPCAQVVVLPVVFLSFCALHRALLSENFIKRNSYYIMRCRAHFVPIFGSLFLTPDYSRAQ